MKCEAKSEKGIIREAEKTVKRETKSKYPGITFEVRDGGERMI